MRSAIIEAGIVVNVIVGEIEGSVPCPEAVSVGWTFDGATFHPPAAVEPEPLPLPPISGRQVEMALRSINITAEMVEAEINLIADPLERDLALIEWRRAGQFERNHPLVAELAEAFALPASEVDSLWLWASSL